MVDVVQEAEDAAASCRDGDDVHGRVRRTEEHIVRRADDVARVGVDDAAVADDGDTLAEGSDIRRHSRVYLPTR